VEIVKNLPQLRYPFKNFNKLKQKTGTDSLSAV